MEESLAHEVNEEVQMAKDRWNPCQTEQTNGSWKAWDVELLKVYSDLNCYRQLKKFVLSLLLWTSEHNA